MISAGEDGFVKVWSRNGLLRSTVIQSDIPCYSALWSPDSSAILYTKGEFLVLKNLNNSAKVTKVTVFIHCTNWTLSNILDTHLLDYYVAVEGA